MEGQSTKPPRVTKRLRHFAAEPAGVHGRPAPNLQQQSHGVNPSAFRRTSMVVAPPEPTPTVVPAPGIYPWSTLERDRITGLGFTGVNVANLNYLVMANDMKVAHRELPVELIRTYNSLSQHDYAGTDGSQPSNYGNGWTNTLDAHIAVNPGSNGLFGISVYDEYGTRYDYQPTDSTETTFTPPPGQHSTLVSDSEHCNYYWMDTHGTTYQFHTPVTTAGDPCALTARFRGEGGRLVGIVDRNEHSQIGLAYSWDNGVPSSAATLNQVVVSIDGVLNIATLTFANFGQTDNYGNACSPAITYRELQSLQWPDGTTTYYKYDCSGDLVEVDKPGNTSSSACQESGASCLVERYAYVSGHVLVAAAGPRWDASLSNTVNLASGSDGAYVVFNPVSGTGEIASIQRVGVINPQISDGYSSGTVQPLPGGVETYETDSYAVSGGVTTYSDTYGHLRSYTVDTSGQERVTSTTQIVSSATVIKNTYAYDDDNNVAYSIDANGNRTDFGYNADGDPIAIADPSTQEMFQGATIAGRPTTLFSYDQYDNIVSVCDPVWSQTNGDDWNGTATPATCPTTVGSVLAPGPVVLRWNDTTGGSEPFGELTDVYNSLGYHEALTYTGAQEGGTGGNAGLDFGQVTTVTGDPIVQSSSTYSPTVQEVYDQLGDPICRNLGEGWATTTYDSLGRELQADDPDDAMLAHPAACSTNAMQKLGGSDIVASLQYFPNGAIASAQTPAEAAAGAMTRYAYDPDGDETQELSHFGCAIGASCPGGKTLKWYDGDDRLVEVALPTDSSDGLSPWLTRYRYDITQGGTIAVSAPAGNSGSFSADGNLYAIQTYLPTSPYVSVAGWRDEKGFAYDAVDRPVGSYFLPPTPDAQLAFVESTATYDAPGQLGEMSSATNPLGTTASYAYDQDGRTLAATFNPASNSREFAYDPDGRIAQAQDGVMVNNYAYNAIGLLTQSTEAVGEPWAATMAYTYYANGLRAALSVQGGGAQAFTSMTNLIDYQYRPDGVLQTLQVNYPATNILQFAYSYTAAGRFLSSTDPYTSSVTTETYDSYGRIATYNLPVGQSVYSGNSSYDDEGEPTSYTAYGSSALITNQFNVRGELVAFAQQGNTGASLTSLDFDGLVLPVGTSKTTQQMDPVDAANIANYVTTPIPTQVGCEDLSANKFNDSTWTFDKAGREAQTYNYQGNAYDSANCGPQATYAITNQTISMDASNQETAFSATGTYDSLGNVTTDIPTSITYDYDGAGHVLQMAGDPSRPKVAGYGPKAAETVFWDGDAPLFTTNSAGAVDDLKVGSVADITTQGTGAGLTVWDRDPDGQQVSYHGTSGVGSYVPATEWTGPGYTLPADKNGVLFTAEPRLDGLTDGHTMFVGDRTLDLASLNFTSPDSDPGSLDSPLSLKPYVFAGDNPMLFGDPSGNDYTADPGDGGDGLIAVVIAVISDVFGGIFDHKHNPPPRPIQAPSGFLQADDDPESQAAAVECVAGANKIACLKAIYGTLPSPQRPPGQQAYPTPTVILAPDGQPVLKEYEAREWAFFQALAYEGFPHLFGGKKQNHHVWPGYLGGARNGMTIPLDPAYHQLITNAFRANAKYGVYYTPQQAFEALLKVYSVFPPPPGYDSWVPENGIWLLKP